MQKSSERWQEIRPSEFPWEREALSFLADGLPDCDPYRVWSNFEFVADDGSIYEVDALVLTPAGFWFVEIKSWPGPVTGDAHTWIWHSPDGPKRHFDNPTILANTKAKKLKSLLARQPALRKHKLPFLEAKVFLSHETVQPNLDERAKHAVCVRDRASASAYPGVVATLKGTISASSFGRPGWRKVDTPMAKAISKAMGEAGIRKSQRSKRVGDWLLDELLEDGPGWQDFSATHQGYKDKRVWGRVRIFGVGRDLDAEARDRFQRAAQREFERLRNLPSHPGILKPESLTHSERGPALVFPYDPKAERLDHYLEAEGERLSVDERLNLLRRLAEILAWAHRHRLVHRTLSPQSVLVERAEGEPPQLQVINWQTATSAQTTTSRTHTGTSHPDALVEEVSLVYMAPEARQRAQAATESADVFSLGAIAYRLFANKAPAVNLLELTKKLREGEGLQLVEVVDGAVPALCELIANSTHPSVSERVIDTAQVFLEQLEAVEEELTQPEEAAVDPMRAKKGDRLEGGLEVEKVLGVGATAIAFRVEREGQRFVLKLALSAERNQTLEEEAEVLRLIRHKRVVSLADTVQVGERFGLLLSSSEGKTLRERLAQDGRLTREFLQRFGDDLLAVVDYLDQNGLAHRDLKPDNMLVAPDRTSTLHLQLFDFSLARASHDKTRVGTPDYMDPFLPERGAWDGYAERWSAAVTLYEMATKALPLWGDGQSDPASIRDEVTLQSDLFEASVREALARFFTKALRRKATERFDNALDMRQAWERVFKGEAQSEGEAYDEERLLGALVEATPESPITTLPFGGGGQEILERLGVVTVRDALGLSRARVIGLRTFGQKTRRSLLDAIKRLKEAFPEVEVEPTPALLTPPASDAQLGIEDLAAELTVTRRGRPPAARTLQAQRLWAGLEPISGAERPWPSKEDVQQATGLARAKVTTAVEGGVRRWQKSPPLRSVRDELAGILEELGAAALEELEEGVEASRGGEERRPVEVRAVVRACLEAEQLEKAPRWSLRRVRETVFVAREAEQPEFAQASLDYVEQLGRAADQLACAEPLPAPQRVEATLRRVSAPEGFPALPAQRLVRLATRASAGAAATRRLEVYPRGLEAARALRLAAGAIAGLPLLSPKELRERVALRYPEAEALPQDRRALDALIQSEGLDLQWSAKDGAYQQKTLLTVGASSAESSTISRKQTGGSGSRVRAERTPEQTDAQLLEERLERSVSEGGFLVLRVPHKHLDEAAEELGRFGSERVSVEERLLKRLRGVCEQRGVAWSKVLEADAAGPEGKHWSRLTTLIRQALDELHEDLLETEGRVLLTEVGVLERYGRVDALGKLRSALDGRTADATTPLRGAWVLVAEKGQYEGPVLGEEPIPVIGRAQWAELCASWLRNMHRTHPQAAGRAS